MPTTASSIPSADFEVMISWKNNAPPIRTVIVFECPITWYATAEKRPRHRNCETFTASASAQVAKMVRFTLISPMYSCTHLPVNMWSRKGPLTSRAKPIGHAVWRSISVDDMPDLRCIWPHRSCCEPAAIIEISAMHMPTMDAATLETVTIATPAITVAMHSMMGTENTRLHRHNGIGH